MQNQLNSQYIPQQAVQPCYQPSPTASVGAVNIQIFNPTAYPYQTPAQGFYQAVPCASYPCNYNNMTMQPNVAQQQNVNGQSVQADNGQQITPSAQNVNQQAIQPTDNNLMAQNSSVAASSNGQNEPKKAEESQKPKVPLTDDYIKTLENYLNSQDKKIRLMGAKELFDRFKEDETRVSDPALTALLNKVLQDPSETVKFVGLTALDTGYAIGNDETVQILKNIQTQNTSYGEDASLAAQILLKMSGKQAKQDAGMVVNPSVVQEKNLQVQPEQNNLNKMPNDDGILLTKDNNKVAANALNNNQAVENAV